MSCGGCAKGQYRKGDYVIMKFKRNIFSRFTLSLLVLALWFATATASGHNHLQRVKFPLQACMEQRARIDSTMQAQPGVCSATWSSRHQILVVVYDRMLTNRRRLKRVVDSLCLPEENKEGKAE